MLKPEYAGCVYAATNKISGRRYIGKTTMPLSKRIRCHKSSANHGSKTPFHGAIRKYGPDAFEWSVLYMSHDESALLSTEVELIAEARRAGERLYNRAAGGEGATGATWTRQARRKLSDATKGKSFSDETRKKLSDALRGKPKSKEHIAKMARTKTGRETKPWTPERRAKMEAAWARWKANGFQHSAETRAKQSEAGKRRAQRPGEREWRQKAGRKGAEKRWRG
jgi:group I intron endonuclease